MDHRKPLLGRRLFSRSRFNTTGYESLSMGTQICNELARCRTRKCGIHGIQIFIPPENFRTNIFFVSLAISKNLVNRALIERNHEEITVRSGLNIGNHSEISSDQQAFAFGHIMKR